MGMQRLVSNGENKGKNSQDRQTPEWISDHVILGEPAVEPYCQKTFHSKFRVLQFSLKGNLIFCLLFSFWIYCWLENKEDILTEFIGLLG